MPFWALEEPSRDNYGVILPWNSFILAKKNLKQNRKGTLTQKLPSPYQAFYDRSMKLTAKIQLRTYDLGKDFQQDGEIY